MEKRHYYMVTWTTRTRFPNRRFSHEYETETEAEAVEKARQVSENILAENIRVAECESWETPEPAPYGTLHVSYLRFIAWQEN